MKTTHLYLIRHGQSLGNLRDVFLGHTDLDLTPLGRRQAELVAEYLRAIPASAIYSSDLKRAYHTALPTARVKGLTVQKTEALREIFAGEWENQSFHSLRTRYRESFSVWMDHFGDARCDGGESICELMKRVTEETERLAKLHAGETIFLFTHATPIRILKAVWDGAQLDHMDAIPWPSNSSVTHAEYCEGSFHVREYSVDSFMGDLITRLD